MFGPIHSYVQALKVKEVRTSMSRARVHTSRLAIDTMFAMNPSYSYTSRILS